MSKLTNREVILAKIEGTYGVDPTPAVANDEVKIENFGFNPAAQAVVIDRVPVQANFVPDVHVVASQLYEFTFDCEIKGSGAAGTAPEFGALLQACAWSETISGGVSVTYKPASTSLGSVTIYYYADGVLMKAVGCRGNVSYNMVAGERMMASFTLTGHRVSTPTDVSLVSPTFNATVPPPFQGASFTIDSYASVISSLDFDGGANVIFPKDVNQSDGIGDVQIVAPRNITGNFDPEHELVATEAYLANYINGTSMALTTGAVGSTAGNIITITMPVVRYREASFADSDGRRTLGMGFQAYDSSGDDAVSIAFT